MWQNYPDPVQDYPDYRDPNYLLKANPNSTRFSVALSELPRTPTSQPPAYQ